MRPILFYNLIRFLTRELFFSAKTATIQTFLSICKAARTKKGKRVIARSKITIKQRLNYKKIWLMMVEGKTPKFPSFSRSISSLQHKHELHQSTDLEQFDMMKNFAKICKFKGIFYIFKLIHLIFFSTPHILFDRYNGPIT